MNDNDTYYVLNVDGKVAEILFGAPTAGDYDEWDSVYSSYTVVKVVDVRGSR